MLQLQISDLKGFVRKLLMEEVFDTFQVVEAGVKSDVSYHISGRINPAFYDTEELAGLNGAVYITWAGIRQHIYQVIKGKKLPLSFKIVFILSAPNILRIIEKNNLPISLEQVANLSLNIYYDGENINITTMASMKTFSTDKTLEQLWDQNVLAYFKKCGIISTHVI